MIMKEEFCRELLQGGVVPKLATAGGTLRIGESLISRSVKPRVFVEA